jgi:FlaA1/EpsC-like NDP-sugar epimerase
MIRLSGADPDHIRIAFTGLRPGEKLFEEPLATGEATLPTPHPKLRIAQARPGNRDAVDQMVAWLERDRAAGEGEVRVWLKNWIPEYAPPGGISAPIAAPAATVTPAAPAPTVALLARRSR